MDVFSKKLLQKILQNPRENVVNFVGNFSHQYFSTNTYNQLFLVMGMCTTALKKTKKTKTKQNKRKKGFNSGIQNEIFISLGASWNSLVNIDICFPLHKKWSFTLRISSINVTKSAVFCGFGHFYWRNS